MSYLQNLFLIKTFSNKVRSTSRMSQDRVGEGCSKPELVFKQPITHSIYKMVNHMLKIKMVSICCKMFSV